MLFFANSQRHNSKRYVSIPVNCIESVNPGKKAGKPVVLHLQPNFDLLSQMKVLQFQFLDDGGTCHRLHDSLPAKLTLLRSKDFL